MEAEARSNLQQRQRRSRGSGARGRGANTSSRGRGANNRGEAEEQPTVGEEAGEQPAAKAAKAEGGQRQRHRALAHIHSLWYEG